MGEITTAEVLELLASAGQPVTAGTWRGYVARGQAPSAVRRIGREPLYDEDTIRAWIAARPGQGARTDRRRRRQYVVRDRTGQVIWDADTYDRCSEFANAMWGALRDSQGWRAELNLSKDPYMTKKRKDILNDLGSR